MNVKTDNFLIYSVFQPIVDLSQRKPRWWAMQMGILQIVLATLSGTLFGFEPPVIAMLVFWTLAILSVCSSDAVCAIYGSGRRVRMLAIWIFVVLGCCGFLIATHLSGFDARRLLASFSTGVLVAFEYFAACHLPRPPTRRTSTKLSTSGVV